MINTWSMRVPFIHACRKVVGWVAHTLILVAFMVGMSSNAAADGLQDCQQNTDVKLKVKGCSQLLNLSLSATAEAEVRLHRGWAYERLGQYSSAIDDLTQSIRLNASTPFAYVLRGGAYEMQQRYDFAIADFNKAIELRPDFVEVYQDRGACRLAKGDTADSIADFSLVIEKMPEMPGGYYMRARAYLLTAQSDAAIADLTHLINLNPKWKAIALFYRALANGAKGRNDLAESDFSNAIALDAKLALERRWVEYLKSIQADRDYANWQDRPYDLYLRLRGF